MRWDDKGVPKDLYPLLDFRHRVRSLDGTATGPMLVHCSAGVGRTGTFIALDILLDQAAAEQQVDIFGVVERLRHQRMYLVQVLVGTVCESVKDMYCQLDIWLA